MAKKKSLKELKASKDVYRRKRAKAEALAPVTDLNTEIRQKVSSIKGTPKQVEKQSKKVKELERENRRIRDKRRDLEGRYAFEDEEGKKRIDEELKKPELQTKDLFLERNLLKALKGKDFDFIVDDGFKKYKVNTKKLKAVWRKEGDATLLILKKMEGNAEKALQFYNDLIEKEKETATKARMKKLKRIRDGLEDKLLHTINQNISAIENDDMSELDEESDEGEKAYSLLFKVVGFSIDRIGI